MSDEEGWLPVSQPASQADSSNGTNAPSSNERSVSVAYSKADAIDHSESVPGAVEGLHRLGPPPVVLILPVRSPARSLVPTVVGAFIAPFPSDPHTCSGRIAACLTGCS